jgi:glycerol-3-phosphate dehydrogenase
MSRSSYDVAVIGGGIHGAGALQAAAAAGYRAVLLEKNQLAHGTSSRSSKLIHGGLRYLETAQIALVHESLREREILLRIAPDLVRRVPFYVPVYRETSRRPWQLRVGLSLYAILGGMMANARFSSVPRRRWPDLDGLDTSGLQAIFRYWDAQTDDAALTQAVVDSARGLGARLLCPATFVSARRIDHAYRVAFRFEGRDDELDCAALVNAAGPWANRVLESIGPTPPKLDVDLVQGSHIVVGGEIRQGVYYAEAPRDRRAVFVMPWEGKTLVGTTESPFDGDPEKVQPLWTEIGYLQETLARYFPSHDTEVLESFAGLRVLPRQDGSFFRRPRETIFLADDRREPRLITLYGGKLTAYRSSARKLLRRLRPVLPARSAVADTATLPLVVDRRR